MARQLVYISPVLVDQYGSSVNNIASLLCLLSRDGKYPVTATENFLQSRTGIKVRTIANAKKALVAAGLIKITTRNKGLKRFSEIVVLPELVNMFDVDFNDDANIAVSDTQELHDRSCNNSAMNMQNLHDDNAKIAGTDHAKIAYKTNKTNIEINSETNTFAPPQNFDPQLEADIAFYEFMQEMNTQGDRAPQIDNHTQSPNFATSANADSPVEPKTVKPKRERKPRIQQPIPQSADEVMPYIDKFLKRHEKEGSYININKEHYAGRILDYYLKDDGTWRDNKNNVIHEPYRKVSAWLSKEYENGKLVRGTGSKPVDIFSDEFDEELRKLEREMLGEDETSPIEASYEVVDDENQNLLEDKDHE